MNSIQSSTEAIQNEKVYLASSKFESCDSLLDSVRAFYYAKGYGLSIRDSEKDKYVTLQCDRGGSYRDTGGIKDKRKKKMGSRLMNCPFQIKGKKGKYNVWEFKEKNLTHNHDPSSDISGHPSYRRLQPENVQIVKNMSLSGIPPRQILASLREENKNLAATSRTIYNLKAKINKDNLGNRSKIGAFFEELEKGGFTYDVEHDFEGRIVRLFIAHPLSIKLAKVFSNIFVMDCTYKTNRFNMPLLDIIGVSCFNTSFFTGFVFLETEDEENYIWALNAFKEILGHGNYPSVILTDRELALMNGIKNVFPTATNLLCVWHIEKNVLAKCKKYFDREEEFDMFMLDWNNVVYSTTEPVFEKIWSDFELSYIEKKDVIEYIKDIWLPWKERFVSAWTEKYLHFGNRATSRAEGAHSKLKRYLQVSTGGFHEVKEKIRLAVEHEFNEIKVKLASERIHVLHDCDAPIFKELLYNVSHFALKKIYDQYKKGKDGTMSSCIGHFTTTMGLPCAHKIKYLHGTTLSLDLIHLHWRIDTLSLNSEEDSHNDGAIEFSTLLNELNSKYHVWPLDKRKFVTSMMTKLVNQPDAYFEPVVHRPKGRPLKSKKKKGITSTTRDPSRFEHVESSLKKVPLSSTRVLQTNNEAGETMSYMRREDNFIDLNAFPDFSSDFTF